MKTKFKSALSAMGLAVALTAGPAVADPTYFSPFTVFHDDDLDRVFDNDNSGTLTVGDRLVSVVEFFQSQGISAGQGPISMAPAELTAVADITITGVNATTGVISFGASGGAGVLSGFAAGTTVAVFLDQTPDLDVINSNCGTRAQCLALAGLGGTDGSTLYLTLGFFGDPDNAWVSAPASGGANIAVVQAGAATQSFGTFNLAQQVGVNNTGRTFGPEACGVFCGPGGDGFVTALGNGQILGGAGLVPSEWTARSKADLQLAPIPEPGSLALLGLALAGLSVTRRRSKSA